MSGPSFCRQRFHAICLQAALGPNRCPMCISCCFLLDGGPSTFSVLVYVQSCWQPFKRFKVSLHGLWCMSVSSGAHVACLRIVVSARHGFPCFTRDGAFVQASSFYHLWNSFSACGLVAANGQGRRYHDSLCHSMHDRRLGRVAIAIAPYTEASSQFPYAGKCEAS